MKERVLGNSEKLDSEMLACIKCYMGSLDSQSISVLSGIESKAETDKFQKTKCWAKETRHIKSIYTKFRNRQSPSLELEVKIELPCGGEQLFIGRRAKRGLLGCW